MVRIFSRVQRCNVPGAPNGFYKFGEQFDASPELAKQLTEANICKYVAAPEPVKKLIAEQPKPEEPANVEAMPPEAPEVIPEPEPQKPAKKPRR